MRGQFQLFSLVRCARMGRGACCKPKRKFATWTFRSLDHRTLGQAVPQHFNFAKDVLDHWSQLEKDGHREAHPALWEVNTEGEEDKWSFERMSHFFQKAASILSDTCGLNRGDRLMIILGPAPETYCIFLACVQLGITFVPGTPQMTAKEILYQLHTSKAQCIVVNKAVVPLVDSVLSNCPTLKTKLLVSDKSYDGWLDFRDLMRVAPPKQTCVATKSQDPMAIFFTNRTTSSPQMVAFSHYGLGMGFSQTSRQWMDLQPTDVFWYLGDALSGSLSLSSVLGAWLQGACVFLHHMPTFCPETVLNALHRFPITTLSGNPGVYQELLQHKHFISYRSKSLKHCVSAGGPISPGMIANWKCITKLNIYEGYAKTETGLLCATSKQMKLKPGSLGKPLPPYIVQIVDENSNTLPAGEEGNIAFRVQWKQPSSLYYPHMEIIFHAGTTQLKAKDILYRLQVSKAQSIVTTEALAPEVDSMASECPNLKTKLLVSDHSREGWLDFRSLMKSASPEHTCVKSKTLDPMVIFFTSGTTGYPKMAKHSHGFALRSSFPSSRRLLQLKTSDVFWCLSDPGWILAVFGCLLEPWTAGSTLFIHHLSQFEPKVIVETFFKYPITQCIAAPGVYRMILQKNFPSLRFPCLEHCSTGGEPLLPQEREQWRQRTGILIHEVYGQSETALCCGNLRDVKPKPGSMGKASPPYDVQIIDSKGNVLPPNTEGNIGIRVKPIKPIGLFMCYENDPAKTAEVECGDFYNTGDRATMDEEGYFWFLGRSDDVINASGYRIGPAEVENALAEHPAVAESAVVGSPDPTRGEVVKAFVVLTQQFMTHDQAQLTKELQEHVKSVTAPYKYPRKVEFVPELPKTVTGKIRRSELRKRELGQK
ncbi:LOW QUALITY PROTEIN: acyl-coenzyme A synthetase ACSM1, mitochondrial-like [Talpa occidentalis]|uniref:LOW QUALITY PROTEIN: acyl-coenzyme A synthetase ACSM1, mitochondrial-like n=1 Tax=Talpa occidentalis TaxID=50954 RepID=UPI0023F93F20|nr:LOW QUALITY PROTEIN: acyl-coenzyme A synthetase ACSM1, mitochondrial-like [Talpa occidentalis]